ncbi:protein-cysteine N-palmitoyltransferase HHAT-like [Ixodes scapularis]
MKCKLDTDANNCIISGLCKFVHKRQGVTEHFLTSVTVPWTVLRCLSFSVDFATDPGPSDRRFPDFWMSLAYVFYLPSMCLGPLINYDNFVAQLEQPHKPWTVGELVGGLMGLVRSAFHLVLRDLMNHYFYSSALTWIPSAVSSMDLPSLVGFDICLNFMFYVKYLAFYGVPGALARLDRVRLPPPPTCIVREHLCSHFWSATPRSEDTAKDENDAHWDPLQMLVKVAAEAVPEKHTSTVLSSTEGYWRRQCGFVGFESLKSSEHALQYRCGVTTTVFSLLLSLTPATRYRKSDISVEDKRTLFL